MVTTQITQSAEVGVLSGMQMADAAVVRVLMIMLAKDADADREFFEGMLEMLKTTSEDSIVDPIVRQAYVDTVQRYEEFWDLAVKVTA